MNEGRSFCAACANGDRLYVIGGFNGKKSVSSVEVFDTITQKWLSIPNMTTERDGCAAISIEDKIYVFGGSHGRKYLSSAEVYDITTQEWTQIPEMKEERVNCAATAIGNRIYIVGGWNDSGCLSSCEIFNSSTNTWSSSIPDMTEKKWGCKAISIGPNIYVMGGEEDSTITSSVEMFEIPISSLYPINDNYVTLEGEYHSPKSLENLCVDQVCRSLPDLDGQIPPGYPQDVINVILESLVSHGALNITTLKAFKHYELDQLPRARCSGSIDERLLLLFESLPESKT